jgi:hypothetical protein
MVDLRAELNSRQLEVLKWIADGSPDDVMPGHMHKTTAVALQNRRLITISKKGGLWRAEITGTGSHYLERGVYPANTTAKPHGVAPRRSKRNPPTSVSSVESEAGVPAGDVDHPKPKKKQAAKRPSPTDQMIADLVANGGEMTIESTKRASYEARVSAAIRFGKVPDGKLLEVTGSRWNEFVIRLTDLPPWLRASLDPIPVPTALRKPHSIVNSLQERGSIRGLDRSVNRRALLLIHALATEAERRGYMVSATKETIDHNGWRHAESKDDFTITAVGHLVGISLSQISDRTPHEPTAAEVTQRKRYEWSHIPKYDFTPSKRLSLQLSGFYEHRQSKWADTATRSLEDCLPQILQEIELRAASAERRRLDEIKASEVRRQQWEVAMDEARVAYREDFRKKAFTLQVDKWLRAQEIRDYLQAMQSAIDEIADPDAAADAAEWLEWCTSDTESIDPLKRRLAMPDDPLPEADDLKPFLAGFSPWGPEASYRR